MEDAQMPTKPKPTIHLIKRFGWIPDKPDHRDKLWQMPKLLKGATQLVDLRPKIARIYDQGDLGSCTANAAAALVEFVDKEQGTDPVFEPARLFIYYNTRILEGTVNYDSGATIRNSIKSVVQWGFPPEPSWPYEIKNFKKKPLKAVYNQALLERITKYERVSQTPEHLKARLAQGFPITFGFTVYPSFLSDKVASTGQMPMPKPDEPAQGGHAVLLVGYDEQRKVYFVQNSWGTGWGDKGTFYMPYDFVHNTRYCADFWTVTYVP